MTTDQLNKVAPVGRDRRAAKISVVLPVYNEDAVLHELTAALTTELQRTGGEFEIVYVNDGSTDGTRDTLDELSTADSRIVVVHLARNFQLTVLFN